MRAVRLPREKFIEFPMKRPGLTPHLFAATLFLAGGLPAEETKPVPPTPAPKAGAVSDADAERRAKAVELEVARRRALMEKSARPGRAEDLLKRFDKNGDGKLDEDEQAEAHEVMLRDQMARQATKTAASPDGGQQYRQKMLEMFDQDHDGRLSDEERAEVRKYAEERGLGENGVVREELVRRFDKNADGQLDVDETVALRLFLRDRRPSAASLDPESERARLDKVAEEVARRRAAREKASQPVAPK